MDFFAKLSTLNPFLAYFLIFGLFLGVSLALSLVIRRFTDNETRRSHNDIAGFIFTIVGTIYAVLLAFITVVVWEQYSGATENVAKEAAAAWTMERNLRLYPDQEQSGKVRQALLTYLSAVIDDEFPAMKKMKLSPATDQAMDNLWGVLKKKQPQTSYEQAMFDEILKDLNRLSQLRFKRLWTANSPKLVGIMRVILFSGAIITLLFAVTLGSENFWWHVTLIFLLAIMLSTVLFVLMELAHPFTSAVAIRPTDFQNVLQSIK